MWLLSDNSDNADDDSANDEDYISNDWKQVQTNKSTTINTNDKLACECR
jgi:hypothetical protein